MILLDTCAILWLATGGKELSPSVLRRLDDEAVVAVSAISAFEIALKTSSHKLHLPLPVWDWWRGVVDRHRLSVLAIDADTAIKATELPPLHRDSADRFIISTALLNNSPVVTADRRFVGYGVTVLF